MAVDEMSRLREQKCSTRWKAILYDTETGKEYPSLPSMFEVVI